MKAERYVDESHDHHVVLTETVVKGFTSWSRLCPIVFSWLTLCAVEQRIKEREEHNT